MKNECLRLIENSEQENSKDLLIEKMKELYLDMADVADDMSEFDVEIKEHGEELRNASKILLSWVKEI